MLLLALETATREGSLALIDGSQRMSTRGSRERTHSQRLPGELLEFLALHGHVPADLDLLAVVSGPGSFTGLRIGLAAIQGIAMVTGKSVIPVSTMDAMSTAWRLEQPSVETRLMTCLDGARGDVFYALFNYRSGEINPDVLVPAAVQTPEAAAAHVRSVVGDSSLVIVGNGTSQYADTFLRHLSHASIGPGELMLAEGAAIAASRSPELAVAPHALRPHYVRRPDAVLARERERRKRAAPVGLLIACSASPEDLKAVADLQRQSFSRAWGADAIQWELSNTDAARLYTVRENSGALVAYCACWLVVDELHINSLAVEPSSRRQGIARWLLERVLADAVSAGARSATLEVRHSNSAARALYEGLGFRVEGVRRNYYEDPREDALILWRRDLGRAAAS